MGDRAKDAVREYARARQLPVADKPDSQEICFIPDDDYAAFVIGRAPDAARPGSIVDEGGRELGRHSGIHRVHGRPAQGPRLELVTKREACDVLALNPADGHVVVGPRHSLSVGRLPHRS